MVTGWPEDLEVCLNGLLAHAPAEVRVDVSYTGESPVVVEQVRQVAGRFAPVRLHELGAAGWGTAQQKLLSLDTSQYYVTMDV